MHLSIKNEGRSFIFDNYKGILIFLVVIGHFIEPAYGNSAFIAFLKFFIFAFHMPAFIFITGYFSKHQKPMSVLLQRFIVPYLIFEGIYYCVYTLIIGKETSLALLYPKFSLWFLLAVFVYKAITPFVKRIPGHMAIAVILGLAAGFWPYADNFLSIPRIFYFYPFYLLGVGFTKDNVAKIRIRGSKIAAMSIIGIFTASLIFISQNPPFSPKIMYGRYTYDFLGETAVEGILIRLTCYGIGLLITLAFLAIIPDKKSFLSTLGQKTMGIYLFHGLVYNIVKDMTSVLQDTNTFVETSLLLAFCISLTLVLATAPFQRFTDLISNLNQQSIKAFTTDFIKYTQNLIFRKKGHENG